MTDPLAPMLSYAGFSPVEDDEPELWHFPAPGADREAPGEEARGDGSPAHRFDDPTEAP